MRSVLVALAALGLAAVSGAPAAGQAEAPPGPVRTPPDWAAKPDAEAVAEHYPTRAQRLEVEGRATINCGLDKTGKLSDCWTFEESPEGYGFGDAAVALAAEFRMKPATVDGQPVDGGRIRIPITFRLPTKVEPRWSWGAVGVVLAVFGALAAAIIVVAGAGRTRLPDL